MIDLIAALGAAGVAATLTGWEGAVALRRAKAKHRAEMKAAERLCRIYFEIAEDLIGTEELRFRRDTLMAGEGVPGKQADVICGLLRKLKR